nr:hypothetical protein [Tanacetum cinerariifolium]
KERRGSSRGDATNRCGSKGGASKRGRGLSKRGRCSNTMPLQGLKDESSDEEHQFKMDIQAVYEMEREQITNDEDDQFWEDYAREFDQVEEHRAQDKERRGSSRGDATNRCGSKGGASKRGRGLSKRGRCSNTMPLQGLKDESSDEEHQFKMDIQAVYEMEREQITNDEDDQFWEDYAREFDQVEEHRAQDKGMIKDVYARKQQMIEDDSLQVGADLPIHESTIEANPKPIISKKSKQAEDLNQMRIFHKNRGRFKRIFY